MHQLLNRAGLLGMAAFVCLVPQDRRVSAQAPHQVLAAGMAGVPGAAAGMVHQAQMMKMFDLNGDGVLEPNEVVLARSGLGRILGHAGGGTAGGGMVGGGAAGGAVPGGAVAGGGIPGGGMVGGGMVGGGMVGGGGIPVGGFGGGMVGGGGNPFGGFGGGGSGGMAGSGNSLAPMLDQNGNGRLDPAEMLMAQMMMSSLAGGLGGRPATGFMPGMMRGQMPIAQPAPMPAVQPPRKGRRKRVPRPPKAAKPKKFVPAQKPPARPKRKVKARGPMVQDPNKPAVNPAAPAQKLIDPE